MRTTCTENPPASHALSAITYLKPSMASNYMSEHTQGSFGSCVIFVEKVSITPVNSNLTRPCTTTSVHTAARDVTRHLCIVLAYLDIRRYAQPILASHVHCAENCSKPTGTSKTIWLGTNRRSISHAMFVG